MDVPKFTPTVVAYPSPPPRDLIAPDTEPTDAELYAVMVAARDAALERRKVADAWVTARRAGGRGCSSSWGRTGRGKQR